ncbi:MAG: YggU family protein [Acidobacteria bacterium]|nr:YggU family protein [Acidobacteriota bacterium]
MSDVVQFARDTPDGCTLSVRVHPGAKRDAVTGLHPGAVKIALNAPPVDGKANEALIAFVAERVGVPRSKVALIAGMTNRSKTLRIAGKSAAEVEAALSPTQNA